MSTWQRQVGVMLAVSWLLVVLYPALSAQADQGIKVTVEGYAHLGEDRTRARDQAILDAIRRGVEQALGGYLDSRTILHNFDLLEDSIFSQTRGYVSTYSVIDEREDENLLVLLVAMVVKESDVEQDLQALRLAIQRKGNPRVAVIVPYVREGRLMGPSPVETEVIRHLVSTGFEVVTRDIYDDQQQMQAVMSILDGSLDPKGTLHSWYDVTYLVVGKARPIAVGEFGGLVSYRCRADLQIIQAELAQVLAVLTDEQKGVHIKDTVALQLAAEECGLRLGQQVATELASAVALTGHTIRVQVDNCTFATIPLLERRLRAVRLTDQVFFREFRDGRAVFDVVTSLPTFHLAEAITWWNMGLTVHAVTASTIAAAME